MPTKYLFELSRYPESEFLAFQLHNVGQYLYILTTTESWIWWLYLDEEIVAFPVLRQVFVDDRVIEAIVWHLVPYPLRIFGIGVRHGLLPFRSVKATLANRPHERSLNEEDEQDFGRSKLIARGRTGYLHGCADG